MFDSSTDVDLDTMIRDLLSYELFQLALNLDERDENWSWDAEQKATFKAHAQALAGHDHQAVLDELLNQISFLRQRGALVVAADLGQIGCQLDNQFRERLVELHQSESEVSSQTQAQQRRLMGIQASANKAVSDRLSLSYSQLLLNR